MKELKRLCLEELKRDMQAGKIEGLPTSSAAAFASNKRQSNLTTITQKKEIKQNQSQQNTQSKGELHSNPQKPRLSSKNKEASSSYGTILNPALTSKIKRFIEKKKKQGFVPKSLE
jgi:hypothetical protein